MERANRTSLHTVMVFDQNFRSRSMAGIYEVFQQFLQKTLRRVSTWQASTRWPMLSISRARDAFSYPIGSSMPSK